MTGEERAFLRCLPLAIRIKAELREYSQAHFDFTVGENIVFLSSMVKIWLN